jgi:hypothetical protein
MIEGLKRRKPSWKSGSAGNAIPRLNTKRSHARIPFIMPNCVAENAIGFGDGSQS